MLSNLAMKSVSKRARNYCTMHHCALFLGDVYMADKASILHGILVRHIKDSTRYNDIYTSDIS